MIVQFASASIEESLSRPMVRVNEAVILAGGSGTRMLPASLFVPKETLPLVDTPLINHLIWEASRAGASKIHLVLSERKKELLDQFIGGSSIHGPEVRSDLPRESLSFGTEGVEIIPHVQASARGVADAISVVAEQIEGPFLVILGDMLMLERHLGPNFSGTENASRASQELVSSFEKTGLPCVGVCAVEPSDLINYGVVELSDNLVIDIVEKPSHSEAPSMFVLCGRYLLPERTSDILDLFPVSEFGEMQSIYFLKFLMENGGLNAVKLDHMKMYDSGDPLTWLISKIDHALRREDIGPDLRDWILGRMRE